MNNTNWLLDYIHNHQPEVIFFDIGRVLVDIDFKHQNKLTLDHFGINLEQYKAFIKDYFHRFLAGEIHPHELDQLFTEKFGIEESLTDYWQHAFKESYTPNEELLEHLDALEEEAQLSIISNIFPGFLEVLKEAGLLDRFEHPIYSCEAWFAKPDVKIFLYALTQFADKKAENCLFIDDKNEHLQAASKVDLQTYRYTKFNNPKTDGFTNV